MSNQVDTEELGEALGLKRRRISQLVHQGIIPPAQKGRFDLVICLKSYCPYLQGVVHRRETLSGGDEVREQRARLLGAKASDAEIDLMAKRGELVPLAAVEEMMSAMILQSRQQLLQLPGRVCGELEGEPRHVIKQRLTLAIHSALAALAQTATMPPMPDGHPVDDPAPAVNGDAAPPINGKHEPGQE